MTMSSSLFWWKGWKHKGSNTDGHKPHSYIIKLLILLILYNMYMYSSKCGNNIKTLTDVTKDWWSKCKLKEIWKGFSFL